MKQIKLSPQQEQVYRFLVGFEHEHHRFPRLREIADAIGVTSVSTVHGHIHHLERKGWIRRTKEGIEVLPTLGEQVLNVVCEHCKPQVLKVLQGGEEPD